MEETTTKRKGIGAKMRFEVFKRDQFKCVYCGASAPNVVLHADHVKPVSKGGKNTILNLITACSNCNSGKSNIELSDSSTLKKQVSQAQEIQERREQLEMMSKWIEGLETIDNDAVDILEKHWFKEKPYSFTDFGRSEVKKLLKKFTMFEIAQAMNIAKSKYLIDVNDQKQWTNAFKKAGGIAYMAKQVEKDPDLKEAFYCRGIIKKRINTFAPDWAILNWIKELISYYGVQQTKGICVEVKNWTQFKNTYEHMVEERDCNE